MNFWVKSKKHQKEFKNFSFNVPIFIWESKSKKCTPGPWVFFFILFVELAKFIIRVNPHPFGLKNIIFTLKLQKPPPPLPALKYFTSESLEFK